MVKQLVGSLSFALCLVVMSDLGLAQTPQDIPLVRDDLPTTSFRFDTAFDPTQTGTPNSRGQTLINQHRIAQQQVEFALEFLQVARDEILSGNNAAFNHFFGGFYDPSNAFGRQAGSQGRSVRLLPRPASGLVFTDESDMFFLTRIVRGASDTSFLTEVREGDLIFIHSSAYIPGTIPQFGWLRRVVAVFSEDEMLVDLLLPDFSTFPVSDRQFSLAVSQSFTTTPNPVHYDRVVSIFTAIRNNLGGSGFFGNTVTYNGTNANSGTDAFLLEYPNDSSFRSSTAGQLNQFLGDRPANRAVRQDGYSNSNSRENIDSIRLGDVDLDGDGFPDLIIRRRNATDPLPWVSDDGVQDEFEYNGSGLDNPNPGQSFGGPQDVWFNDVMTIWGNNFDPQTQNVGNAFFREEQRFAGDFFGTARQASADRQATPAQWQMILASYAEQDPLFDDFVDPFTGATLGFSDTAFVGIMEFQDEFFPDGSPFFFEARDAGNYADFAALFRPDGVTTFIDGIEGVSLNQLEPLGKRASAFFFPVIPESLFNEILPTATPGATPGATPVVIPGATPIAVPGPLP